MEAMTDNRAMEICKDIRSKEIAALTKRKAIRQMLKMTDFKRITKAELIEVMRWQEGIRVEDGKVH